MNGFQSLELEVVMTKIGVMNYGSGNLLSIINVLNYYNIDFELIDYSTKHYDRICAGYILPGVGSFKNAMDTLNESGLGEFIMKEVGNENKPILGICLGMQLLFDSSTEGGGAKGLGLIKGSIQRFESLEYKVPHVGWNQVSILKNNILLPPSYKDFYFDHSFYVDTPEENIVGKSKYIREFASIVNKGRVFGVQFHPEKSQVYGTKIIHNFFSFCDKCNA